MSVNMALAPWFYFPSHIPSVPMSAQALLGSGTVVQSAAATTTAATTTTTTTTTSAAVGSAASASASATSAAYAAFAAVAVPIAVTVLAALASGVAIDVINFQKKLHKQNFATVPTVFTSKEKLIEALYAYDKEQACTVYSDGDSSVTARFRLEDYEFTMNEERGMYDLTIRNAGSCETILAQINTLQQEYIKAVRSEIYSRLINGAESNNWSVESETEEDDGTLCIRLTV